jgi:hypothetical protein
MNEHVYRYWGEWYFLFIGKVLKEKLKDDCITEAYHIPVHRRDLQLKIYRVLLRILCQVPRRLGAF